MRISVILAAILATSQTQLLFGFPSHHHQRTMVSLTGRTSLVARRGLTAVRNQVTERPPDPNTLLTPELLQEKASILMDWWRGKRNVFCITGAGLSTDSGIPDYRGNNGSYHRGHKPIIHQQYMESEFQRKRYWGRSMVGWKGFDLAKSNVSFP